MASQRPPSSMGRPMSRSGSVVPGAGRPPTAVRPPPTAIRVATGMVPGTSGHPGMRGGIPIATPGVLSAQIKVTDRPVTQQGLSGMKTGIKGPQRQILDKSYYLGLLRSKINELTTETSKLHKEIDNYNQENSVYLSYEKRAEGLAAEIKDLQGQLADYNMVNSNCKHHFYLNKLFQLFINNDSELFNVTFSCSQELSHSQIKQEVVRLHETLSALEAKRDAMEAEQKSLSSPKEELEKLFKQVSFTGDGGGFLTAGFLESFEESRAQEQERMSQSQENIVSLLEHCSRNMLRLRQVDTVTASELRNMQEVLVSKETEVVQSDSTARGLTTESQRLQQDLEKVQQLEGKITGELSTLKERVNTMESELLTYRDLDTLRHTAEEKKKRLQEDQVSLTRCQDSFGQLLEEMNQKYEALKTKLEENETHAQLANLERKWQHLEQNNFVMKEFIASKSQESHYASVAKNVFHQVAEYNRSLIESLQSNKS
uniref:IF rod domain-containing protein n=1 Tax=Amphiprion ocellaris TaxID=80972 RepID=A0AAQ5Y0V0_AMPOC